MSNLCEACWKKPRASPAIYVHDDFDGRPFIKYVCFDCAVEIGKEHLASQENQPDVSPQDESTSD